MSLIGAIILYTAGVMWILCAIVEIIVAIQKLRGKI